MAVFDKVAPGDRFQPYAVEWNRMLDIARNWEPPLENDRPRDVKHQGNTFLTVVATEAIDQFAPVEYVYGPDIDLPPNASVATDDNQPFGIAVAPLSAGEVSRIMIQGTIRARIEVIDDFIHNWVIPSSGVNAWESSLRGRVRIVGAVNDNLTAGVNQEVKLQFPFIDEHEHEGTAVGLIAKGETNATVNVGLFLQTGVHFDRYYNPADPDISDGQQVAIRWFVDESPRKWRIIRARCEV